MASIWFLGNRGSGGGMELYEDFGAGEEIPEDVRICCWFVGGGG